MLKHDTMNVTRKNFNRLHDALLKHFGAEEFVILDYWCRIGIKYANGHMNALATSKSYFDIIFSNALSDLLFKRSIMTIEHDITLGRMCTMYNIPIDEAKMAVIRSVLKCMKHGNVFVVKYNYLMPGKKYVLAKSYAEFAVNFDLNN